MYKQIQLSVSKYPVSKEALLSNRKTKEKEKIAAE